MYIIPLIAFLLLLVFIVYYRKQTRRKKTAPLSTADIAFLNNQVRYYEMLPDTEKQRFNTEITDLLSHISVTGAGVTITREDELLVAASAVIPIFNFEDWHYHNLKAVLLYPDTFTKDFEVTGNDRNVLGMVGTGSLQNQMILSRNALWNGFASDKDKSNTAIHEFVHLLDKSDGAIDGIPEHLLPRQHILPWLKVMKEELNAIQKKRSSINPYALTNNGEFFAVVSEYFFERPKDLQKENPELYALLCIIFRKQKP